MKKRPPFKPTPFIRFDQMPGYLDAANKEREIRDEAYLGLNRIVAGYELRPLLFKDYLLLRFIGSPLLFGGTPTEIDIARFLWLQSPEFGAERWFKRALFMRRCRRDFRKIERAAEVLNAIRDYMDESKFDAPSGSGESGSVDYYSDACSICNLMGRELGRSRDETLNTPMGILLQELREIKHQHLGSKAGLTNPLSSRVSRDFVASLNKKENN